MCTVSRRTLRPRYPLHDAAKAATGVYPADAQPETPPRIGPGRPFTARYRAPKPSCKDTVITAGPDAAQEVSWRHGTKTTPGNPDAVMRSQFVALRARPAGHRAPRAADGWVEQVWLLAEWPIGATEPADYWLSSLPVDTPIDELVRLAKLRWRIAHDYRELKVALGLDHFEGRSWLGWHHHATLVTATHLFLTTLRLTDQKPVDRADPLRHRPRHQKRTRHGSRCPSRPHARATGSRPFCGVLSTVGPRRHWRPRRPVYRSPENCGCWSRGRARTPRDCSGRCPNVGQHCPH